MNVQQHLEQISADSGSGGATDAAWIWDRSIGRMLIQNAFRYSDDVLL